MSYTKIFKVTGRTFDGQRALVGFAHSHAKALQMADEARESLLALNIKEDYELRYKYEIIGIVQTPHLPNQAMSFGKVNTKAEADKTINDLKAPGLEPYYKMVPLIRSDVPHLLRYLEEAQAIYYHALSKISAKELNSQVVDLLCDHLPLDSIGETIQLSALLNLVEE